MNIHINGEKIKGIDVSSIIIILLFKFQDLVQKGEVLEKVITTRDFLNVVTRKKES